MGQCYRNEIPVPEVESTIPGSRPRPKTQKNPRPRTAFPRTDPLEAKDRNARGQGQGPRTQAQMFSTQKRSPKISSQKKVFKIFFPAISKRGKQKGLCKFSARYLAFFNTILSIRKRLLYLSRGLGNFRELEASRPRPRTSKYVLEDSTSDRYIK